MRVVYVELYCRDDGPHEDRARIDFVWHLSWLCRTTSRGYLYSVHTKSAAFWKRNCGDNSLEDIAEHATVYLGICSDNNTTPHTNALLDNLVCKLTFCSNVGQFRFNATLVTKPKISFCCFSRVVGLVLTVRNCWQRARWACNEVIINHWSTWLPNVISSVTWRQISHV